MIIAALLAVKQLRKLLADKSHGFTGNYACYPNNLYKTNCMHILYIFVFKEDQPEKNQQTN